jgi:two-component system phosphate regulon sensor histidine kinase PhoR
MKKSIFSKIFGCYTLIVLTLSILFLFFSFRTIRHYYLSTLTENLKNLGITLSIKITPFLEEKRFQELDALVKNLGNKIKVRITIIDPKGNVLADSKRDPKLMENHKNRPEVIQALKGNIGKSLRYSTTMKEDMLYVAMPIEKERRVSGVLRTSLFLSDINSLLDELKSNIIRIAVVIILISLFVAFIFSRTLTKPIRQLIAAYRKVASGNFDVKVFLRNKDEMKELADNFNTMTEQIKTLFKKLSNQKEELNSIISSVQEGLSVMNKEGKILLSNESFKRIVQNNFTEGRFYWEIIREPKFTELIKKVKEEKKNLIEELELNDRIYLCSATFLEAREETIVIFHDMTDMKNVEKIKRDFVVNVSHELRTPLTAIKGYTETLEEEVDEKSRRYVEIIKRNTDRLISIVQDLLLLSELEEKGTLEIEKVNIKEIVENVIRISQHRLEEKNLYLKLNIENDIPPLKADFFKLEQILINLIDNAIKYTEKGEITVSVKRDREKIIIEIKDTGIGIPKEHLNRIFERFYVVDKSRSRKLGGTGLGLSIVKHIVILHKGKIDVESIPGAGTKFIITLPINLS